MGDHRPHRRHRRLPDILVTLPVAQPVEGVIRLDSITAVRKDRIGELVGRINPHTWTKSPSPSAPPSTYNPAEPGPTFYQADPSRSAAAASRKIQPTASADLGGVLDKLSKPCTITAGKTSAIGPAGP